MAPSAGSKRPRQHRSRPACSRRLVASRRGAVLVGALNMDEYAYGFTTENHHHGPTRNPHDTGRIAGGSSGGSAAAVAAGLAPLSLGSDTNGSIRVPASLCGVFGLKPTYGRLSRSGAYLFAASFDHVGPFARDVADLALAYDALQGADSDDPAQQWREAAPVSPLLDAGTAGLRIAVAGGHFARNGQPEAFAAAAVAARALGAAARARCRKRRAAGPRPSSSPWPRAATCTCPTCGRAPATSTPWPATASSPARCCPRRGSCRRSGRAPPTGRGCCPCSRNGTCC